MNTNLKCSFIDFNVTIDNMVIKLNLRGKNFKYMSLKLFINFFYTNQIVKIHAEVYNAYCYFF